MTNVTKRRMTADEMAVLREIVKWRRATGGEYLPTWSRYRLADGRSFAWLSLDSYATCMKVGVCADIMRYQYTWHRIDSIQQGIDLLVALGYVPARFSSAYRAGWDARSSYSVQHSDPEWLYRQSGDAPLPDFPAVEPAW